MKIVIITVMIISMVASLLETDSETRSITLDSVRTLTDKLFFSNLTIKYINKI